MQKSKGRLDILYEYALRSELSEPKAKTKKQPTHPPTTPQQDIVKEGSGVLLSSSAWADILMDQLHNSGLKPSKKSVVKRALQNSNPQTNKESSNGITSTPLEDLSSLHPLVEAPTPIAVVVSSPSPMRGSRGVTLAFSPSEKIDAFANEPTAATASKVEDYSENKGPEPFHEHPELYKSPASQTRPRDYPTSPSLTPNNMSQRLAAAEEAIERAKVGTTASLAAAERFLVRAASEAEARLSAVQEAAEKRAALLISEKCESVLETLKSAGAAVESRVAATEALLGKAREEASKMLAALQIAEQKAAAAQKNTPLAPPPLPQ